MGPRDVRPAQTLGVIIKRIIAKIPPVRRLRTRIYLWRALQKILADKEPKDSPVVEAIRLAIGNVRDAQHRSWISRIENRRSELKASSVIIQSIDYGSSSIGGAADNGSPVVRYETISEAAAPSKSAGWAILLFQLVRCCKPKRCIEVGTCVGMSGAYIAAALQLNGVGRLTTLEGGEGRAAVAKEGFAELGLQHRVDVEVGRFEHTLPEALDRSPAVDFVFFDGHHTEEATKKYFELVLGKASSQAILLFDDINIDAEMRRAWQWIRHHDRSELVVEAHDIGLVRLSTDGK